MFDKRDYRRYKNVKRDDIYPKVCDFWARQGFYVAQLSPFQIRGESYHQKIGLRREFYLRLDEQDGNTYIDLQFQAKISDEGAVGGVAAAVIFWPVAVVGGALSYSEYEKEANSLMYNFWIFVDQLTNQRGELPPGWRPPEPSLFSSPAPQPGPPPPNRQYYQQHPLDQKQEPPKDNKVKEDKNPTDTDIKSSTPPEELSPSKETAPCKNCGALLPNNWKACPYCGTLKE
jgi:hypothetical protein